MKDSVTKILSVTEKIKTPLALSGLVVIILYLIFKQILTLNIFSNLGSGNTFSLLQNILSKVFWIAIVAVVLGVSSHVIAMILKHQIDARSSNVQLVDSRLDPHDSPYEEVTVNGKRQIQPKVLGKGQGDD